MFPEPGYESITVSCIKNTLGKNFKELNQKLGEKGYMISTATANWPRKHSASDTWANGTCRESKKSQALIDSIWGLK